MFPIIPISREGPQWTAIPLAMIAPHEAQAWVNHGQTLARLAERGGLSACEAVAVLEDRRWFSMTPVTADARLTQLVAEWQAALAVRPGDVP